MNLRETPLYNFITKICNKIQATMNFFDRQFTRFILMISSFVTLRGHFIASGLNNCFFYDAHVVEKN